jgi:hypothetical protein
MSDTNIYRVPPREQDISNPHLLSRFITPSIKLFCQVIIETGGGVFAGIFPPIGNRSEALVVWASRKTGTALGCLLSQLSAELVRKKTHDSDSLFEVEQEKSAIPAAKGEQKLAVCS